MARKTEIVGMKELEAAINRLGKVPQGSVTKAARAGANIALKAARKNAPEDTGELKRGLILKGERRVKLGKKVFDVMMDPAKNNTFAKTSAAGKRSYYPASQEYGWITASGQYIPGYRYFRHSIEDNTQQIERKTVDVLAKDIDKALRKG